MGGDFVSVRGGEYGDIDDYLNMEINPPSSIGKVSYKFFRKKSKILFFMSDLYGYVGDKGFAFFKVKGVKIKTEVVNFQQMRDLYFSEYNMYANGIYTGTRFEVSFVDHSGGIVFKIKSGEKIKTIFRFKPRELGENSLYRFFLNVEREWSAYKLPQLETEFEKCGFAKFQTGKKCCFVRVGDMRFFLDIKDKTYEWARDEVSDMRLFSGLMVVKSKKQKTRRFLVNNMANRDLFFHFMARHFNSVWK